MGGEGGSGELEGGWVGGVTGWGLDTGSAGTGGTATEAAVMGRGEARVAGLVAMVARTGSLVGGVVVEVGGVGVMEGWGSGGGGLGEWVRDEDDEEGGGEDEDGERFFFLLFSVFFSRFFSRSESSVAEGVGGEVGEVGGEVEGRGLVPVVGVV